MHFCVDDVAALLLGTSFRYRTTTVEVLNEQVLTEIRTNRYSMPVTGSMTRNRVSVPDYSSVMGLGHINTTGFLFGDDDEKAVSKKDSATSPDVKSYLQMNATDDKFPILVRRDDFPGLVGIPQDPIIYYPY